MTDDGSFRYSSTWIPSLNGVAMMDGIVVILYQSLACLVASGLA